MSQNPIVPDYFSLAKAQARAAADRARAATIALGLESWLPEGAEIYGNVVILPADKGVARA